MRSTSTSAQTARAPKRLRARDAAVFVLAAIASKVDTAGDVEEEMRRSSDAALTDDEREELQRVLDDCDVGEAFGAFAASVAIDRRVRRKAAGRAGAPSRDVMRSSLRHLRTRLAKLLDESDQRKVMRAIAMLILLHGVDAHGAFWRQVGAPPKGAQRVRWLVRRLTDLHDDGAGQYTARRARAS